MADLIDRAEAIKLLMGEAVGKYPQSFYFGLFAAAEELKKLPSVDAVPVVRCKDCNRNEKNGGDCNRTLTITERDYVLELNVSKYITLGFCSYGERKET